MQPNPDHLIDWRASGRRITIQAVVIALHLGMAMALLRGPTALWHDVQDQPTRAREILQLRFVSVVTRKSRTVVAATTPSVVRVGKRATITRATPVLHSAIALSRLAPPKDAQTPADGPEYISGGSLLNGTGQFRHAAAHLPGSTVAIVPGLHMIDPRMQGVAGAVRALQGMLGVPDPHCVDVDAWRTLSTQELLDRHVSPEQVESTAAEYHCFSHHT